MLLLVGNEGFKAVKAGSGFNRGIRVVGGGGLNKGLLIGFGWGPRLGYRGRDNGGDKR
jgi:hypothetical protein